MKLNDLKEELKKVDEVQLLELLEIDATDLVERFDDRIKERREFLVKEFEDDNLEEPYKELDFEE
jgi:anion-transporting  ArsA/GET3 family ATPase